MSVTYSQTVSATISGLTTTAGSGITLLSNPAFSISNNTADDYLSETYTINPSTPETAVDLGLIALGQFLWVQTNQPILLTLNQPVSGMATFAVNNFLLLDSTFSSLSIANPGSSQASVSIVIAGDRNSLTTNPGIF